MTGDARLAPRKPSHGFALIEILTAIAIVGIALTAVSLRLDLGGRGATVDEAALGLVRLADTLAIEALYQRRPFGINIESHRYRAQVYEQGEWRVLESGANSKALELDAGLRFTSAPHAGVVHDAGPELVFMPDGDRRLRQIRVDDDRSRRFAVLEPAAGTALFEVVRGQRP